MKLFKRVSAVVASAAMAATMAITASAATADDVKAAAQAALLEATATIDKATSKGVYHKNTSSRKVSRLNKAVNQMA